MEITDIEEQRILSFIRGEMTAEEEARFKAELQANAELRQKAALLARLTRAMRQVGTEQDRAVTDALSTENRADVERLSRPLPSRSAPKWQLWTSVAAVVLLVVGLYWGFERHHMTSLGQEYAALFEPATVVRGEMEPGEEELASLGSNVINGQHLEASVERLHLLYELSVLDEENCYSELSFTIGWYLACGYLQLGERQAAIDQLERLGVQGFDKSVGADKVQELLEKLR